MTTCTNSETFFEILRKYESGNPEINNRCVQYLLQTLYIGRPLSKVMIVMLGQSGAGKSTTINNLFDDPNLCPTDGNQSMTTDVTEYGKQIEISNMKVWLSFVDTPGALDTNSSNSENLEKIKQFRNNHPSFKSNSRRMTVYPNIVLVTVDARNGLKANNLISLKL